MVDGPPSGGTDAAGLMHQPPEALPSVQRELRQPLPLALRIIALAARGALTPGACRFSIGARASGAQDCGQILQESPSHPAAPAAIAAQPRCLRKWPVLGPSSPCDEAGPDGKDSAGSSSEGMAGVMSAGLFVPGGPLPLRRLSGEFNGTCSGSQCGRRNSLRCEW
jgi:hypothetical protein